MMSFTKTTYKFLILIVSAFTFLHILPTLIHYAKPFADELTANDAKNVSHQCAQSEKSNKKRTIEWLHAFVQELQMPAVQITENPHCHGLININFSNLDNKNVAENMLRKTLSQCKLPFTPLSVLPTPLKQPLTLSLLQSSSLPLDNASLFKYIPKNHEKSLSNEYKDFLSHLLNASAMTLQKAECFALLNNTITPKSADLIIDQLINIYASTSKSVALGQRVKTLFGNLSTQERDILIKQIAQFEEVAASSARKSLENDIRSAAPYNKKEQPITQFKQTQPFPYQHPFIESLVYNAQNNTLKFQFYEDIQHALSKKDKKIESVLYHFLAPLCHNNKEAITLNSEALLYTLGSKNRSSVLTMDHTTLKKSKLKELQYLFKTHWNPQSPDLKSFPFLYNEQKNQASQLDQKFCIHLDGESNSDKICLSLIGLSTIINKHQTAQDPQQGKLFYTDLETLSELARALGLRLQPYEKEISFEWSPSYYPLSILTQEKFITPQGAHLSYLELSNKKQRQQTTIKQAEKKHEALLALHSEYQKNKAQPEPSLRCILPKPTQNAIWSNLSLSVKKYLAGDSSKVVKWGLDLFGGKTVTLAFHDDSGDQITDSSLLSECINALHKRVNKLGVSEVAIRQQGDVIVLDFPSSQEMNASELIHSSKMTFHIVNENFSPAHPDNGSIVSNFLTHVWEEALVRGKTDEESINEIAYNYLYGDHKNINTTSKMLLKKGLALASSNQPQKSVLDTKLSKIAVIRNSEKTVQVPLMVVFHHYALKGADLCDIQGSYDPSKGHFLSFGVNTTTSDDAYSPQKLLKSWTERYAHTTNTQSSLKWRMAAILNGEVITAPNLQEPIFEQASITGNFSHHEVDKLTRDLKAGSMRYTPKILSESTVSAELGSKERSQGIFATALSLAFVIALMLYYYRLSGLFASIALIMNFLLMWAILQHFGATITLATLAGVVLTLGMAVDANVLIFERIREELTRVQELSTAIQRGFQRALSAILDANITTIIAAIILFQFDSGPIKGFSLALIVGIVSSLFTALFVTRFLFSLYLQRSKTEKLSMKNLFSLSKVNFMKKSPVLIVFASLLCLGSFATAIWKNTDMLGIDFKGGYSFLLPLHKNASTNYTPMIEKALSKTLNNAHCQVQRLPSDNSYRIYLNQSTGSIQQTADTLYQALKPTSIPVNLTSAHQLQQQAVMVSGQISDRMQTQALMGMGLALLAILAYITIRFEYRFAIAATVALFFDCVVTLAIIVLSKVCGLMIEIDLQTIAAMMTIIGYSLNDTIVVFDRIRENRTSFSYKSPEIQANTALCNTFSRTIMTSLTTLFALLSLVFLGGASIFSFSYVMTIGVCVGTLSTYFVASKLWAYLEQLSLKEQHE